MNTLFRFLKGQRQGKKPGHPTLAIHGLLLSNNFCCFSLTSCLNLIFFDLPRPLLSATGWPFNVPKLVSIYRQPNPNIRVVDTDLLRCLYFTIWHKIVTVLWISNYPRVQLFFIGGIVKFFKRVALGWSQRRRSTFYNGECIECTSTFLCNFCHLRSRTRNVDVRCWELNCGEGLCSLCWSSVELSPSSFHATIDINLTINPTIESINTRDNSDGHSSRRNDHLLITGLYCLLPYFRHLPKWQRRTSVSAGEIPLFSNCEAWRQESFDQQTCQKCT